MEIILFFLGIAVGLTVYLFNDRISMTINITHTHIHKTEELPAPKQEGYNESYGDPNAILYYDQQFVQKED